MTNTDEIRRELLPCPFCGGEARFEEVERPYGIQKSAGCNNEDCIGYQSLTTFPTKKMAAKAWNTRSDDDALSLLDKHLDLDKYELEQQLIRTRKALQWLYEVARVPKEKDYAAVTNAAAVLDEQPQPQETGVGELDVEKLIAHITNEFINRQFDSESVIDVSTAVDIVKTKLRKIKQTPQAQPDIGKKVILEERAALLDTKLNPNNALTPIGEAMLELCRKLLDKIEEQALNGSKEVG